jgi:hypothetical protein
MDAWDASVTQAETAGHFGSLPLLVVSSAGSSAHLELQRDLASLSADSHFVLLNAGHMAMLMDESAAAGTAQEIRRFVSSL